MEASQQPQSPAILSPNKSNKKIWIGVFATLGILCIGSIACLAALFITVNKVNAEKAPIQTILDTFMKNMVAKDVESAYNLFSPRLKRQYSILKMQETIEGSNFALYEGYQTLTVQNINIKAVVNANPDMPQGTVADVFGNITYQGGIQGTFSATLEKGDGKWQMFNIKVMVPPSKIKP